MLTGARAGNDLTMVDRYVGAARRAARWTTPGELAECYPEALDAVAALPGPPAEAYRRVFDLVSRHAREVGDALARVAREQSGRLARQDYPADSLLGIVVGRSRPARPSGVAADAPPPAAGAGCDLVVDPVRFEARAGAAVCGLGNTRAFHLLAALADRRGEYLSHAHLGAAAWDDEDAAPNAIQRAASNLRRALREAGLGG